MYRSNIVTNYCHMHYGLRWHLEQPTNHSSGHRSFVHSRSCTVFRFVRSMPTWSIHNWTTLPRLSTQLLYSCVKFTCVRIVSIRLHRIVVWAIIVSGLSTRHPRLRGRHMLTLPGRLICSHKCIAQLCPVCIWDME